jgi:hypothetical protein
VRFGDILQEVVLNVYHEKAVVTPAGHRDGPLQRWTMLQVEPNSAGVLASTI